MMPSAIPYRIDTSLSEALKLKANNGIRHLAVVREGAFGRMVTLQKLLKPTHRHETLDANALRNLATGRLAPDA